MSNTEVECSHCGDTVSAYTARIAESDTGGHGLEDYHYLCPICVITSKNAAMQQQLMSSIAVNA
jgi:hypothetical protein